MKKAYCKLDLWSHPGKNKHPQASAVMRTINEAKEGFEDLLRYNIGRYDNTCENWIGKYILSGRVSVSHHPSPLSVFN